MVNIKNKKSFPCRNNREHIDGFPVYRSYKCYDVIEVSEGCRIPLHDYVMQKKIGREIKQSEVVHHIDLNKRNNNLDNLFLYNRSKHRKEHENIKRLLEKNLFSKLFEKGVIYFDYKEGIYKMKDIEIKIKEKTNKPCL